MTLSSTFNGNDVLRWRVNIIGDDRCISKTEAVVRQQEVEMLGVVLVTLRHSAKTCVAAFLEKQITRKRKETSSCSWRTWMRGNTSIT